ncbi:nuclear transport factor 2 family protein [Streptomyces sp. SAS_276]|uniref:nuclear transport factor 2 family protein n=1 Tax=Streptomyces sp. SAS_276 TaxID=3412745 RepID=UPI00403C7A4F
MLGVFTPDGTYSAFGDSYGLDESPTLVGAAPKDLFLTATPAVDLSGGTATGTQPLRFADHAMHDLRIGYHSDTHVRTDVGWRLRHAGDNAHPPQRSARLGPPAYQRPST